jgi:hypothetical protein
MCQRFWAIIAVTSLRMYEDSAVHPRGDANHRQHDVCALAWPVPVGLSILMSETTGIGLLVFTVATVAWHFLFAFTWWQSVFLGCLTAVILGGLLAIWADIDQLSRHFGQKD